MSDPFLGQILLSGFNFPPKNFAFCAGQLLPISQNTALFSLLGTNYGGNGTTNFQLPNLQGTVPIGAGQGTGLDQYFVGEQIGSETVTLITSEVGSHAHTFDATQMQGTMRCRNGRGNQRDAAGNVLAIESAGVTAACTDVSPTGSMSTNAVALGGSMALAPAVGNSQPHQNMQPYLALNYCIALFGVFPQRP